MTGNPFYRRGCAVEFRRLCNKTFSRFSVRRNKQRQLPKFDKRRPNRWQFSQSMKGFKYAPSRVNIMRKMAEEKEKIAKLRDRLWPGLQGWEDVAKELIDLATLPASSHRYDPVPKPKVKRSGGLIVKE